MKDLEKAKKMKVDDIRVRLPLHLSNQIWSRVYAEGKDRSKVVREALEKAFA